MANFGSEGSGTTVSVIDTIKHQVIKTITVGTGPVSISLSTDGKLAYVPNFGLFGTGNTVSVIDVTTHQVIGTIQVGQAPSLVVIVPNGSLRPSSLSGNMYIKSISISKK